MAHSYTPGLKVAQRIVIQKERRLPLKGEIQVAVGDRVRATDIVARTELPGKVFPINAANILGVSPDRLGTLLDIRVGDEVTKGEVAGRSKGLMGLFASEFITPASGVIESISSVTGQVIIRAHPIPVEVSAYVDGEVTKVLDDEGVLVSTEGALIQGIFGLGGEVLADLRTIVERPDDDVLPEDIPEDCRGQALVGGRHATAAAVRRAVACGAKALIVGGFDYLEVKELLGYEVGVAITGGEQFGLTLVVTEGFGRIAMSDAAFSLLQDLNGRQASINGATQIRAGVIRPEIIVADPSSVPTNASDGTGPIGTGIGDTVRVIRAPWFGRIGTVRALPSEPVVIDTGAKVRVMEIAFNEGEIAVVPRANIENMERR